MKYARAGKFREKSAAPRAERRYTAPWPARSFPTPADNNQAEVTQSTPTKARWLCYESQLQHILENAFVRSEHRQESTAIQPGKRKTRVQLPVGQKIPQD